VERMRGLVSKGMRIENIVLNAGVMKYPNVIMFVFVRTVRKLMQCLESHRDVRGEALTPDSLSLSADLGSSQLI